MLLKHPLSQSAIAISISAVLFWLPSILGQDGLTTSEDASPNEVAWTLQSGDELNLTLEQTTHVSTLGDHQSASSMNYIVTVGWKVLGKVAGEFEIEQYIRHIKIVYKSSNREFKYDSAVESDDLGPLANFPEMYKSVLEQPSTVVLSRSGSLNLKPDSDMPELSDSPESPTGNITESIGHMMFPVDELNAYLKKSNQAIDSSPRVWTRSVPTAFDEQATVKLAFKPVASAASNVVSLSVSPELILSEEFETTRKIKLSSQRGEGGMTFDTDVGIQTSANIKQKVELLLNSSTTTSIQIYSFETQLAMNRVKKVP